MKNKLHKLISKYIIIMLLIILPMQSFAISNPWDKYIQYMPEKMPVVKRDFRAAWISTTLNLDWPSVETRNIENDTARIQRTKEELINILDKAVEMNINAVFLQVSPEADAFYKSNIVPWSRYLTGTFGKDPGFDPLAFAIEEAHKRNIELHAWFNPYRVSMYANEDTKKSLDIKKSVYKEHPEWIRTAKSRFVIDPGIPEARKWVVDRVMEVVNNYDIDGIHFDDYFYYEDYVGELKDQDTFMKYNSNEFSTLGDWRRNNTYLLIKEISEKINSKKPWIKFGVSPAGVWANKKDGHPDGSNTSAGLPNYDRGFADTKKWVEEEIIDYIAPQIYFSFANSAAPYGEVASWWSNVVKNKDVHLYIGQALYKVNDNSDEYFLGDKAIEEFRRQLKFNTTNHEITGSIMFRFKNFFDNNKQLVVNDIKKNLWYTKALPPEMPWKSDKTPKSPIGGKIEITSSGTKLTWKDEDVNTAYYAIYRMNKGNNIDINSDEAAKVLIATVRKDNKSTQEFVDREISNPKEIKYVVTALDRLHNESKGLEISINQSKYFDDVKGSYSWAIKALDKLYEERIVSGVGSYKFLPGNNISRADFLIMVMKSYGIPIETGIEDNFSDAGGRYYTDYLATAKKIGLVSGVGDNLYMPESPITRQDMIVILHSVLEKFDKLPVPNSSNKPFNQYNDSSNVSQYAQNQVKLFVESGIIKGDGENIRPKSNSTRAETAQVIYNLLFK